jgi:hypothetical protein
MNRLEWRGSCMSLESVKNYVLVTVQELALDADEIQITLESPLVGNQKCLDSMGLVELCVRLEDYALSNGASFDWTSEDSMSTRIGMFRSINTLSEELFKQMKNS